MSLVDRALYIIGSTMLLVIHIPHRESSEKTGKHPSKKKGKIRRGSLSHQKAVICKGKMGPHAWDSKKKRYEKEAS
jgi:hypothetical protein